MDRTRRPLTGVTRRALTGVAVIALLLTAAAPAGASCAGEPLDFLADADAAFVGTVHDLSQRGSVATVTVDSVWKGPGLAPTVAIRVGTEQPPWPFSLLMGAGSSVDAQLRVGRRYLFLPIGEPLAASGELRANSCLIEPFGARVARAAPAETRPPSADGIAGQPAGWLRLPFGAGWLPPAL
nr:hypothetical protein [Euzebyales bacterium]